MKTSNISLRSPCHVEIRLRLLFLLNKNSMSKSLVADSNPLEDLKMNYHLLTEGTHSPSDKYPTNIRSSYSQDADFVKNVIIIDTAQSKTSLPELQR
ncbi:hypothetical protein ACTXT7_003181 [Hymenolepis weldensis]